MKIKNLLFASMMFSSCWAAAESYVTFVDTLGTNTVALTLHHASGRTTVDLREVVVNGKQISGVKVAGSPEGQMRIEAGSQVILEIPSSVSRSEWSMQDLEKTNFKDGDSRILKGSIVLNGKPVSRVLEIYAAD